MLKVGDKIKINNTYNGPASHDMVFEITGFNPSGYSGTSEHGIVYIFYYNEVDLIDDKDSPQLDFTQDVVCNCESFDLFHYGCRCGAFQKEKKCQ